jgi:hypothetical protein
MSLVTNDSNAQSSSTDNLWRQLDNEHTQLMAEVPTGKVTINGQQLDLKTVEATVMLNLKDAENQNKFNAGLQTVKKAIEMNQRASQELKG